MTGKNLLAGETSPYLQQHRNNPVHWQPWGQAALDSAVQAGKPILLSVGYSACHWCHVMAHECFEDPDVADVMNALFVNIKVDREERPDIDQIYMAALSATGEQGGWPLTMFLTPDARPFWGGTYFPKQARYGRPGFIDVMNSVHQAWTERRSDVNSSADNLRKHVAERLSASHPPIDPDCQPAIELGSRIADIIDPRYGGISGAPKFPNAPYMTTLWLSDLESAESNGKQHVVASLEKMLNGGIYDHIGGGLCRYSTDAQWLIPHFEKMLYDNAHLIRLCVLAHAETGNPLFRDRIEQTIGWLEREMLLPTGAYASSLDADSEGEEGKFYLWTTAEIEAVLENTSAAFFKSFQLVSPAGWEGNPVLIRKQGPYDGPQASAVQKLLHARANRTRPARDGKTLTDWNGSTIYAIAAAARYFGNDAWKSAAMRCFAAIRLTQDGTGRLPHSVNGDTKLFPALSQDYAAMINAAISLHELTSTPEYLECATLWSKLLEQDHGDGEHSYYLSSSRATDVPIRIRGDIDEATPSATAQIVEALVRLASATGDIKMHDKARLAASSALGRAINQNHGQAGIFNAVCMAANAAKLIVVDDPTNPSLTKIANRYPDPRRVDMFIPAGSSARPGTIPGAELDTALPGAWLCRGQSCLPPARTAAELENLLSR